MISRLEGHSFLQQCQNCQMFLQWASKVVVFFNMCKIIVGFRNLFYKLNCEPTLVIEGLKCYSISFWEALFHNSFRPDINNDGTGAYKSFNLYLVVLLLWSDIRELNLRFIKHIFPFFPFTLVFPITFTYHICFFFPFDLYSPFRRLMWLNWRLQYLLLLANLR